MNTKKIFFLRRFDDHKIATTGVLFDDTIPFAVTLELPYRGNQPFVSCIPTGEYSLNRYNSEKYNTWQIVSVLNRDLVLLHCGNFLKDTSGCILIGQNFDDLNNDGVIDIAGSKIGFNKFMEKTKDCNDGEVKLIIEKCAGWYI